MIDDFLNYLIEFFDDIFDYAGIVILITLIGIIIISLFQIFLGGI